MDSLLQKYYEDRFSTMSTKGWHDFIDDVTELKKPLENIPTIKTVEDLYFRQGQLDIINWVLSIRGISEMAYEELQNEDTL